MEEFRFVCRLCNKRYPCGKSLGGHMRSHLVGNAAGFDEKFEPNLGGGAGEESVVVKEGGKVKMMGDFGDGQSGYGLRENPRKTWRAVDTGEERLCKRCGKAFQSLKALCGHMACHSDRDRGTGLTKDDQSWTSENQKMVLDSCSDTEAEGGTGVGMRMRTRLSRSRRCKKVVDDEESNLNGSSSVSEIDEHDQEEVAMCLMMLSMDNGSKGGVFSVVESSDNISGIVETKSSSKEKENENDGRFKDGNQQTARNEDRKMKGKFSLEDEAAAQVADSDSAYFLEECSKAEESEVSFDGIHKYGAFDDCRNKTGRALKLIKTFRTHFRNKTSYDEDDMALIFAGIESRKRKYGPEHPDQSTPSTKKSRYECFNCKKTFKSYQALGGHRPCHKRTSTVYNPGYESDDNSLDDSTEYRTSGKLVESSSSRKLSSKKPSANNDKKIKPKNNKGHVCPFCSRVFKNGQALGGHKRSHFIGGHDENSLRNARAKAELPDTLDLNLPAPEVDEDD